MNKLILSLFALFVSVSLHASAAVTSFNFADLEWLSSKELVKESLTKKGYRFDKENDNVFFFGGKVAGETARVACVFDKESRLLKVVVSFPTEDSECLAWYARMKESLSSKYGRPANDYEIYKSPFEKGDGHQELAIKTNKATITCIWQEATNGSYLMLIVNSNLTVGISYESKDWAEEADRRRDKTDEDL